MSRLPFELAMALRYLRPRRGAVSFITLISVVGVMLGVAVLIIVIGVMGGFSDLLQKKLFSFHSHLKVYERGGLMHEHESVLKRVNTLPHVKGATPFVEGPVLVETTVLRMVDGEPFTNTVVNPIQLRGIDPETESSVNSLATNIIAGKLSVRGNGILVGRTFALTHNLSIGDPILLFSPRHLREMREARAEGEQLAVLPDEFTLSGVFQMDHHELDSHFMMVSLANAQELFLDDEEAIHGLMVRLDDPFHAQATQNAAAKKLGPRYPTLNWLQEHTEMQAVLVEKQVMFFVLFFVMIVAAFGVTSSLIIFVTHKTKEIGLLKALGASNGQVSGIFFGQGLGIGVAGVGLGYTIGILALKYRNEFLGLLRKWTGQELFPAEIYHFQGLPALIRAEDILLICGCSLLACVLAGLIPAWNAARLRPVEALRHE